MSQLKGRVQFDVRNGFVVYIVMQILEQPPERRDKVIYDIGRATGPRLTLLLDADDGLALVAKDTAGKTVRTKPIPPSSTIDKVLLVAFGVTPHDDDFEFFVSLNARHVYEHVIHRATWGEGFEAEASMFSRINGEHPSACRIAAVMAFAQPTTVADEREMFQYATGRYGKFDVP